MSSQFVVAQYELQSDTQAYKLVHRAKQMFEDKFQRVVGEYARDQGEVTPEIDELKQFVEKKKLRGRKDSVGPPE